MSYKLYLLFIISLSQLSLSAKCPKQAGVFIYNSGIPTHYNINDAGIPIDAFISPGDSVKFYAEMDDECAGPGYATLFFNGDTIYDGQTGNGHPPFHLTVFDTGFYRLEADLNGSMLIFDVTLSYSLGTEIQNNPLPAYFQVIPSISSGIFKINSPERILKQIVVADSRGCIVIQATENLSEINITDFSSGIYYFAITDERENVFRGKIVKY